MWTYSQQDRFKTIQIRKWTDSLFDKFVIGPTLNRTDPQMDRFPIRQIQKFMYSQQNKFAPYKFANGQISYWIES